MAASLYITYALVANVSEQHSLTHLLTNLVCLNLLPHKIPIVIVSKDFYILPVPSSDGHDYTWEADRFWYKNHHIICTYSRCIGLDMNR